jgi:hypothetical protein
LKKRWLLYLNIHEHLRRALITIAQHDKVTPKRSLGLKNAPMDDNAGELFPLVPFLL